MQAYDTSISVGLLVPIVDHMGHALLSELKLVAQMKCRECGGLGHYKKKCPTYKLMLKKSKGVDGWRTYLNRARE